MERSDASAQSTSAVDPLADRPGRRHAALAGLAGLVVAVAFLSGRTGLDGAGALSGVVRIAAREGLLAALWWASAVGAGLWLLRFVRVPSTRGEPRTTLDELAIATALGAAALLSVESLLGSLGALTALGGIVAWGTLGLGAFALGRAVRESPVSLDAPAGHPPTASRLESAGNWATWFGLGAIAGLLFVAASSSPGWLWSSEFGGYDALSYHLTLPKHWLETGSALGPVAGNTYAYLPGFVEAAFMHLMALRGDTIAGAFACQWWAAFGALATAFTVARLSRALLSLDPALTALLVLTVPWIAVVGTLAYNDIAPCLFLAGAWLLLARATSEARPLDARAAVALAGLAAAAFGAKPTAALFVLFPLLALTVLHAGPRALRYAPLVVVAAVALLAPWLVRNAIATGNPFFPFLTGLLGRGAWSEAQVAVFASAHGPAVPWSDRPLVLWHEWIAHGFGAPPAVGEPWFPQWSALPALGLAGLFLLALRERAARGALAVLAIMLAGWLAATHLKSRFLLPTAVPLALGASALLAACTKRFLGQHGRPAARLAALALLAGPFVVLLREPVKGAQELGAPAALVDSMALMTGEALAEAIAQSPPDARAQLLAQSTTPFALNHLVPDEARVIAIGFATPFYVRRHIDTTMVWERGDFDAVVAAIPAEPARWGEELRTRGFTHALIDPAMLERWAASGWLNPAIATGAWLEPFVRANTPMLETVDGKILIALGASASPSISPSAPPSAR